MHKKRPVIPHPTDPAVALVELTQGKWAVIDAADAAAVGEFNWTALKRNRGYGYYARRGIKAKHEGVNTTEYLHRFIAKRMGWSDQEVDHRDGNGLDCRRGNLRRATHAQNVANVPMRIDNTSGVKGAVWNARQSKWVCHVYADKVRYFVGAFSSLDDARVALEARRRALHGEFANSGARTN